MIPKGTVWQQGNDLPIVPGTDQQLPAMEIIPQGGTWSGVSKVVRFMDWHDIAKLPDNANLIVQFANEKKAGELPSPADCDAAITLAQSKGCDVIYPGDDVDPATGWSYPPDPSEMPQLQRCQYYGLHAAVTSPQPPLYLYGLLVTVTELEQDPNNVNWPAVVAWLAACIVPAFYFTYAWLGQLDTRINLNLQPRSRRRSWR